MIDDIAILLSLFFFNIIIAFLVKAPILKHIKALTKNLLFILFIVICNLFFSDVATSVKVGIRLFLAIDYTYIMGCYFHPTSIRIAFYYLLYPLKIFHVDLNSLTLIIAISLAFIPILMDEASLIKRSFQSKGFDFNFHNLITRPHIYLIAFLNGIFERLDELEKSLLIKAY